MVFRPVTGHKLTASLEGREQNAQTTIMRMPASLSRATAMSGDDESKRTRFGLEYEHKDGLFYDLLARVYHQDAETNNGNYQTRSNARYSAATGCSASSGSAPLATCQIEQLFHFEQQTTGVGLQLESMFQLGGASHLLTYGIDIMRQRVETKRDGRVLNVNTGAVTYGLAGETYPLRDFANGVTDTLGVYVQDEISLFANRLSLTPGLRYDRNPPEAGCRCPGAASADHHQPPGGRQGVQPRLAQAGRPMALQRRTEPVRPDRQRLPRPELQRGRTAPSAIRRRSTPRRRTPTSRQRPAWASRSACAPTSATCAPS